MSYCELHKGKLRILTRSNEETKKYIKEHALEEVIDIEEYDGEIDFDVNMNNNQYIILHKDGIYHGKDCKHMLCEYLEHESYEGGGDYIADVKRIQRDVYEFILNYYNGGTCEEEILSEEISKLDKEPYEVEFEMINIGPRESYMILDCFQYVLSKMNEEKIDYLFNNYSKEEIAKFSQQFGDMNLKNGW